LLLALSRSGRRSAPPCAPRRAASVGWFGRTLGRARATVGRYRCVGGRGRCRCARATPAARSRPVAVTGVCAGLVVDAETLRRGAQLLVLAYQRLELPQTTNQLTLEISKLIRH
jgi:hypothetical protein